jgi:hypothetical protein
MAEIHLFVQQGCRPCMYAETQLKKVEGWESVITITNAKENGEWSEFAKNCGVVATPTLVALTDREVVAKIEGSKQMTFDFWKNTVYKHSDIRQKEISENIQRVIELDSEIYKNIE